MYDRNGLQLSKATESLNSYYRTAVDMTVRKYAAYAQASRSKGNNEWAMFNIGLFKDPRDAAYVAQEFEKQYTKEQIRQMVTDQTFRQIANDFVENLEIPEWKYPAEGILIEDILNDYGYKMNYVNNAKEALREVISVFGITPPSLKEVQKLVDQVEEKYKSGISYREAARIVMGV